MNVPARDQSIYDLYTLKVSGNRDAAMTGLKPAAVVVAGPRYLIPPEDQQISSVRYFPFDPLWTQTYRSVWCF
ncbi:hypothetical protein Pmani_001573 [Petrolisthes manimaculis]|uniref:Uncharacterized protein n=1 Tax=Petrolisthes manimaculis TaxID=1843537 RepID=A0AAE1QMU0_9EUCA|nr:hypothetical protein Pmani_001573 [Petrolisthes manimaculis]